MLWIKNFCYPNSDVSLAGYMNGEFESLEWGFENTAVLKCIYLFPVTASDLL
jgi:hypothetical protein